MLMMIATCAVLGCIRCAGTIPTCKVPTAVELEIETSDRVNRDAEGARCRTMLATVSVERPERDPDVLI